MNLNITPSGHILTITKGGNPTQGRLTLNPLTSPLMVSRAFPLTAVTPYKQHTGGQEVQSKRRGDKIRVIGGTEKRVGYTGDQEQGDIKYKSFIFLLIAQVDRIGRAVDCVKYKSFIFWIIRRAGSAGENINHLYSCLMKRKRVSNLVSGESTGRSYENIPEKMNRYRYTPLADTVNWMVLSNNYN